MHQSTGRRAVLVVAVLATALATALSVSPAAAASGAVSTAVGCEFDALTALTTSAVATRGTAGDTPREPTLNETYEALPDSAKGKGGPKFRASVPVWFHVVSPDGVVGNVTQSQIDDQITAMNLGFGGFEGGANTGFSFRLAGVTRTVNAEWFVAGPSSPDERAMKKALRRGGLGTLNYYSTTAGPYLGWAYLPGLTPSRQYLDGIVVDWESMPHTSTTYAGRYDLGKTATHEAGHWLNLEHTFFGGCNAHGDYVADTPAMKVPTSGCPAGKDTCPKEPGLDPIHNYMDYSFDSCYFEFTPGQGARMQDSWLYFRASG
jgi:hypothetical protein